MRIFPILFANDTHVNETCVPMYYNIRDYAYIHLLVERIVLEGNGRGSHFKDGHLKMTVLVPPPQKKIKYTNCF